MADAKPNLARDGTMQVTAKEGIDYLKSEGKTKLLEYQGLAQPEEKTTLQRDGTMAVTAKIGPEDRVRLHSWQGSKGLYTQKSTPKEGDRLLESAGGAPDEDAQTRGQQRKIEEIKNETAPESPAKKAKLAKDSTMVATAKEAKDLLGKEKLGDTRQETAKRTANKPMPKRGVTMAKTLEEAKYVLEGKEVDITEGRRTRSQSKPSPAKPPVKRAGTMQKTAKEGKDYLKRGKGKGKGKKAADDGDKAEDKEEEEEDEKEGEEDEKKEDEKDGE